MGTPSTSGAMVAAPDKDQLATLPDTQVTAMTIRQVLARGLLYWRPYWKIGIVVLGLMTMQELFTTFYDLSIGRITDQVLIAKNGPLLIEILGQLAAAYVIAAGATVVGDLLTARVGAHILNDLRRQLFTHLQRLSMRFFAHAHTGDVVARFTSDLAEIDKGLTVRFTDGNLALIGLLINIPTLFFLQWRLALIVVAVTPLVMLGPRLFAPRASRDFFRLKREQAALASAVQENVKAQAVVKGFGLQRSTLTRLENQLTVLFERTFRATFMSQLVGTTSSLGVRLSSLLVIGVGSYLAFNGLMTIGELVAFILLLINVTGDAYALSKKVMPSVIAAGSGIQRLDELMQEQPDVTDAPDAAELPPISHAIRFEDVCFRYDERQPTLDHVSLSIPKGAYVAFVGPTGAGKTTMLSLITRFYDVTTGAVSVDGRDVRDVTQDSLRAQMATVPQETFLFNTSVRENIRLGKLDATNAEIEAAARAAEIHDVIASLPKGYDTPTGEMGSLLSGGQRQRIAIARAILRDPSILILDEPTSDLDPGTEAAINATLDRLAADRTVIAVTHRLSAVQRADRIFVLDAGRVVEQGRHAELLDLHGLYYRLWQRQHGQAMSPEEERDAGLLNRLRAIPMFAHLEPPLLAPVASWFAYEACAAGVTVVAPERPGDVVYFISSGAVEIVTGDATGQERQLGILRAGDYFGELAPRDTPARRVSIRTLEPSVFLTLQRAQLLDLINAVLERRFEGQLGVNGNLPAKIEPLPAESDEDNNRDGPRPPALGIAVATNGGLPVRGEAGQASLPSVGAPRT